MKLLIILHHRFELWQAPGWFAERLQQDFPGVEVVVRDTYEGAAEELRDAEIVITWSLRSEQFRAAQKLRWIHSPAAAVHLLMIPEILASDVVVTNAREIHGPVVAEHAIALMLALAKCLPSAVRWQGKHVWSQTQLWRETPHPREVAGATLGLIGFGSIGREVARRAAALGMRVLAVREHPEKGMEGMVPGESVLHAVFGPAELDGVLAQSDYVVLAVPLTPRTEALLNAERLTHMRSHAFLINVSRGPLADEAALAEALRQHKIGGAALDVFREEPLPPESPFWDLDNVLITPHSAAMTDRLWERHLGQVSENLRRFLAGQPLLGVVDKHRGY